MPNNIKQTGTNGYNSSLLSFTIVTINIISVFIKLNNGNITSSDIFDTNNILLIVSLFLASLDLLHTYKKVKSDKLIKLLRFFAIASSIFSGFIIFLKLATVFGFFTVVEDTKLAFDGYLANIYTHFKSLKYFELSNCVFCYLFASVLQTVASFLKVIVDKQIKTNIQKENRGK